MSQIPFAPTPNVTTHSDARAAFNANFSDSETRLSALENIYTQQTLSSSGNTTTLDISSGYNATMVMTENTNLVISGASAGDAGIITIRQDSTGSWSMTTSNKVLSGSIATIVNIVPTTGICSLSWYYDGTEYILYVSESA